MKKILSLFILSIMCLGLVAAQHIWTTKNACGDESQDNSKYNVGDKVFINGKDMKDPDEKGYDWSIIGKEISCDSGIPIKSGIITDEDGNFCLEAYTILEGDCGQYQINVEGKKRTYFIGEGEAVVPEFGTVVGILTALGALGVFFVVRKRQ